MGTRRGRGGAEPPGDDDDPFDDLLRPGFSGGAVIHEPSAEERARAAREAGLRRRLAEEEEHRRQLAKRSRRIRREARPRRSLRMVVPALAVVFVAGMAWVQYRDGGLFGQTSDTASRPSDYPPVDKSASPDPLGQPPPIPQPAGSFQFSLTQDVGTGPVAWDPCRPKGTVLARAVVQHELGHVMGLDHVADQAQLMYSEGAEARDWGTGDLAGLHQLGSGACFPDL